MTARIGIDLGGTKIETIALGADGLKQVFQPFFRGARAVAAQVRGSGIGLSVVLHVVQSHGGDVHLASRAGEGTTVTVVLPAATVSLNSKERGSAVVRLRGPKAGAAS